MDIDARELEALASRLTVRFTDGEPRQTIQVDGFRPVYLSNSPAERSDNLPGGGGGASLRRQYSDPNEPYEPVLTAFFVWLKKRQPAIAMIDVGALWGHMSLVAASIFDKSDIRLFEMNPFVAKILQNNLD